MANYRRKFPGRRQLFLHGQSGRSPVRAVDRAYRPLAGGVSPGADTPSLRDRSGRDLAGSPPRDLDPARWRRGFRHPLAPDQKRLFACFARRTDHRQPRRQRRARDLAAEILGAYLSEEDDVARHLDYVHFNPVKHRLVASPSDWPFSSLHRYVRVGILSQDWGGDGHVENANFGERAD